MRSIMTACPLKPARCLCTCRTPGGSGLRWAGCGPHGVCFPRLLQANTWSPLGRPRAVLGQSPTSSSHTVCGCTLPPANTHTCTHVYTRMHTDARSCLLHTTATMLGRQRRVEETELIWDPSSHTSS